MMRRAGPHMEVPMLLRLSALLVLLAVPAAPLAGGSDMIVLTSTGEFDAGIAGTGPAFWNGANQGLPITIIAPGHAEGSPVATPLMTSQAACESGQVAGGMIGEPLATLAEQEGIAVRLATDFPVQDIQPTMIFGNDQFLEENPDAAAGLVAGYLKAARDLTTDFNDPTHLAIIEQYTNVPAELVAESVKPVYATDGTIDLASLTTLQSFFRDRGQLDYDEDLDPATLVDTQYVDAALQ